MEQSGNLRRILDRNRRTRVRLQRQNNMLREQRRVLREAISSPLICTTCNGPTIPPDLVAQETEERFENALLRSELETLTLFMGKLNLLRERYPTVNAPSLMAALSLKEVISLARILTPMWTNERLDLNQYYSKYFPWYAKDVPRFIHDASRASKLIPCDAASLVADLMNPAHWKQIFPAIVGNVSVEQHSHPRYQIINVDFMPQIIPSVPTRNVKFLRCSKHMESDTWVIADTAMFFSSYATHLRPDFLRFPSGYLIQHIVNGVSKVTVLDHWVYKAEEAINLFNQTSGIGAHKWLTALERHYYSTCFVYVPSTGGLIQIFDPSYHTNLLKLSTVIVNQFCIGVCGTTGQNWNQLTTIRSPFNYIRMITRESQDMNGVPCTLVSATGLARMQAKPEVIFTLINRTKRQDIWKYLQPVGDMQEVIRIKRSQNLGNEVIVFNFQEWYTVQVTYYEASEAMIIHTCLEAPYFVAAINGGDFSGIDIMPCGFSITSFGELESLVLGGYQVMAGQATMITSSGNMVKCLEKMVNDTLRNVANVISSG